MNIASRCVRSGGLSFLLTIAVSATASAAAPARAPAVRAVDLTEADVAESNDEIRSAYGALVSMWTHELQSVGRRFAPPRIMNYRGNVSTSCGVMRANNAAYCSATNTIYFDEVFIARQRKAVARALRTDGDMAGVGIIAHEMGHAVAIQLGVASRVPYTNEAVADCLAGAFARQSQVDGTLEDGDIDEAFAGLAAAGDPEVQLTGNRRVDARITQRAQVMGHGSGEQRVANFEEGLRSGPRACLPALARS